MKVWGGNYKNTRAIIATETKKKAIEVLKKQFHFSANYFNDYWCETGNEKEIALASLNEDTVIILPKNF